MNASIIYRQLRHSGLIFLFAAAIPFVLPACGDRGPRVDDRGESVSGKIEGEIDEASPTFNIIYLIRSAGNHVVVTGHIERDGLGKGYAIAVNETIPLEVYEYDNLDDCTAVRAKISPDGSSVEGEKVDWDAPPHFFHTDKTIILYQGSDPVNVQQLASVFGPEFAGGH